MVFDQTFFAQVGPGWTGVDRGGPGVDRGGLGSIHDWSQIGGALCSQHPCSNCCGGHSLLWQLATVQQDYPTSSQRRPPTSFQCTSGWVG